MSKDGRDQLNYEIGQEEVKAAIGTFQGKFADILEYLSPNRSR